MSPRRSRRLAKSALEYSLLPETKRAPRPSRSLRLPSSLPPSPPPRGNRNNIDLVTGSLMLDPSVPLNTNATYLHCSRPLFRHPPPQTPLQPSSSSGASESPASASATPEASTEAILEIPQPYRRRDHLIHPPSRQRPSDEDTPSRSESLVGESGSKTMSAESTITICSSLSPYDPVPASSIPWGQATHQFEREWLGHLGAGMAETLAAEREKSRKLERQLRMKDRVIDHINRDLGRKMDKLERMARKPAEQRVAELEEDCERWKEMWQRAKGVTNWLKGIN
ncbi:MAG: hypothetical protein M1829_001254 [Trizodia sp. TS-e1964]|nr:MAG: hypothetical protein M1829_001254 [Trizodia sp. TS-e1964]